MDKPAICGGTLVCDTNLFYGHQYIDEADIQAVGQIEMAAIKEKYIKAMKWRTLDEAERDCTRL